MNKYDLIVVPVVNEENILVGRITIDDVIDVVKDEAKRLPNELRDYRRC